MNEELRKQFMEAKTDEEKRAILEAHSGELSDEELQKVSSGGCGENNGSPGCGDLAVHSFPSGV